MVPIWYLWNLWFDSFKPVFWSLSASNPLLNCFMLSFTLKTFQKDPITVYLDQYLQIWYVSWGSKWTYSGHFSDSAKIAPIFLWHFYIIHLSLANFFFPESCIPWAHFMFSKVYSNVNYMFTVKFQLRWVSDLRKSSKLKIALKWEPLIGISIRFLRCDPLG